MLFELRRLVDPSIPANQTSVESLKWHPFDLEKSHSKVHESGNLRSGKHACVSQLTAQSRSSLFPRFHNLSNHFRSGLHNQFVLVRVYPLFQLGEILSLPLDFLNHDRVSPVDLEDNVMHHDARVRGLSGFEVAKGTLYRPRSIIRTCFSDAISGSFRGMT